MRDGPLRWTIKRVALGNFVLATFLRRRFVRIRHDLAGQCEKCAACCESPAIAAPPVLAGFAPLRRLFLAWHRLINGFVLIEYNRYAESFVFRCTHFDRESRTCDSYASRPGMCRDYPRMLLEDEAPEFLPACGYRIGAGGGSLEHLVTLRRNVRD